MDEWHLHVMLDISLRIHFIRLSVGVELLRVLPVALYKLLDFVENFHVFDSVNRTVGEVHYSYT